MDTLNLLEASWLYSLREALACPFLDGLMQAVSWLGNGGRIFILLAVILVCIPKTRNLGWVLALALVLDLLLVNVTIKPLVARIRPYDVLQSLQLILPPPGDFSFPSGHTAAAFAAATALWPAGKRVRIGMFAFACIMAFSRLYLTVHYPTDVLGGILCGVLCGVLALLLWKKIVKRAIIKRD